MNNFIPITTLIRTELLKSVGGFPLLSSEEWPHPANEDWGCWKKLLNAGVSVQMQKQLLKWVADQLS